MESAFAGVGASRKNASILYKEAECVESETAKFRAFMLTSNKNEHRNVVASEGIITKRCRKSPLKASAIRYDNLNIFRI